MMYWVLYFFNLLRFVYHLYYQYYSSFSFKINNMFSKICHAVPRFVILNSKPAHCNNIEYIECPKNRITVKII